MQGRFFPPVAYAVLLLALALAPELDAGPPLPDRSSTSLLSAGIYGNTGLWKVFTAESLPARRFSSSIWYDRINRNPGHLTSSTLGFGGSLGVTDFIEFGVSLEAHRLVETGRPAELSFGQQALGFFGDKSPGSPALRSELMPGSSLVPQLRSPPIPSGPLTGVAGYYNLLPFAGLVPSGSAVGLLWFGLKVRLLSETDGSPLGLAIRPHFGVPIHKAVTFLLTHPVGTADLQFGFDAIVSKKLGDRTEVHWNGGYQHISQPAHASVYRLAKMAPLGLGFAAPFAGRIQFLMECTAEVFFGRHTPNTSFGAETPVDVTVGLRGPFAHSLILSAGYRRPVNQFGGDKNGFALSLGYTRPGRSSGH